MRVNWNANPVSAATQKESFDERKGGIRVTDYLRFGSILDKEDLGEKAGFSNHLLQRYHCERCGGSFLFDLKMVEEHSEVCPGHKKAEEEEPKESKESKETVTSNKMKYFCPDCKKELELSATEVLKHKKVHRDQKDFH